MIRLDAHQHFWQYDPAQYPWMSEPMTALRRDHLPGELQPLLAAAGFDGAIAVQARQSLEETAWLLQLSEAHDFIKGIVGWVDLRSPQLRQQLERYAKHPRLVGVRHVLQDEPDDQFMLRPDFRRGLGQLREFGLTYDLLLFPRHVPAAVKLVTEFPEQPFVLDHLAKPDIRHQQISPWCEDIKALAQRPNVSCKLSGMVTEADWKKWRPSDFRPYLDVVLEYFGSDRLMIGSDWPVCTVAADYSSTMKVVTDWVEQLPPPAREAILGRNCARFYGVGD
jgi:L-fuconolactonase